MREEDRISERPTTKLKADQIVRIDIGTSYIPICSYFCQVVRDFDLAQQREVFVGFNEDELFRERYVYRYMELKKSLSEQFFDFLVENDFVRKIDVCFKHVML